MSLKKRRSKLQPPEAGKLLAMYIAMVIRNAMEDFHVEHLSDSQMKELNPIIRNAVYTALHAYENYETSIAAKQFVDFNVHLIPEYWEQPILLRDYSRLENFVAQSE
jgi:hypothetical protein